MVLKEVHCVMGVYGKLGLVHIVNVFIIIIVCAHETCKSLVEELYNILFFCNKILVEMSNFEKRLYLQSLEGKRRVIEIENLSRIC
jgi:hypothetical protein